MTEFRKILDLINENSQELMEVHDSFDIELNDDLVIESGIVGFTEDAVIIEGDDKVLELLSENGALLEETDWSKYEEPTIHRVKKGVSPSVDRTDYDVPPAMRKDTKGKPGYELRKEKLKSMHDLKEKMVMGLPGDQGSKVMGEMEMAEGSSDDSKKYHSMSDAELRDMIEFLKLVGNDKAVAELEGILHSRKGSSSAALEESDGRDNPVVNSIVRRIMISHPDLLGTYGPEKVLNAIYDVAEFVGDVEEIGSSDVSGWVKYVIDSLERHGSNIKESQDKSSVSMPARKLYAKTYAKHAKTVKDAKKAEKMAYDAVKEKFGQEILNQLKKHHNQSKDSKQDMAEAKYQGRTVPLNKPMKGDVKKRKVYVRKPNGNVVKVEFGDKNMRIKKSNPARRKSFRARHRCDNPGPKWKARYWSCRFW